MPNYRIPNTRLIIGPLVVALVFTGCPRAFDPSAAPNLISPNPEANSSFGKARRLFEAGAMTKADSAFAQYLKDHADDPLVPQATVYRGRVALRQRKLKRAQELLAVPAQRPAEDQTGLQARYYLGLVSVRMGAFAEGRKLLKPFLSLVKSDKLPPVLASLALACSQLKDHPAAAAHLARLHQISDRPAEQAYARQRLAHVVASDLTVEQTRTLHAAADSGSLLAALAGLRLALASRLAGNQEQAQRLLQETAGARAAHHVAVGQGVKTTVVQAGQVGLLVPLRGRYKAAGKQLLAGAMEGAHAFHAQGRRVSLVVRDSSKAPEAMALELLTERGVMALAGTLDPASSRAVARIAARHGVAFVSLAGSRAGNSKANTTVRVFPTNSMRAHALATHGRQQRGRRFVTLAPETPYGDVMARAFAAAVKAQGGQLVARLSYPRRSTSFARQAKQLARIKFDALFVPDTARRLALIAPALAKVGLWSAAAGKKSRKGQRFYQLLATGEGISSSLGSSGRYLEAAVLAPGYFPHEAPAQSADSPIQRFKASHGRPPTLVEAFAHDAVAVLGSRLEPESRDRQRLLTLLRQGSPDKSPGLTGVMRFGEDGERVDPALLYRVSSGSLTKIQNTKHGIQNRERGTNGEGGTGNKRGRRNGEHEERGSSIELPRGSPEAPSR